MQPPSTAAWSENVVTDGPSDEELCTQYLEPGIFEASWNGTYRDQNEPRTPSPELEAQSLQPSPTSVRGSTSSTEDEVILQDFQQVFLHHTSGDNDAPKANALGHLYPPFDYPCSPCLSLRDDETHNPATIDPALLPEASSSGSERQEDYQHVPLDDLGGGQELWALSVYLDQPLVDEPSALSDEGVLVDLRPRTRSQTSPDGVSPTSVQTPAQDKTELRSITCERSEDEDGQPEKTRPKRTGRRKTPTPSWAVAIKSEEDEYVVEEQEEEDDQDELEEDDEEFEGFFSTTQKRKRSNGTRGRRAGEKRKSQNKSAQKDYRAKKLRFESEAWDLIIALEAANQKKASDKELTDLVRDQLNRHSESLRGYWLSKWELQQDLIVAKSDGNE
ncbi:hypothetical protein P7C73_g2309, partial [Tremellales sp. Uapishka_1]